MPCEVCGGDRLTPETLAVTFGGKHIGEVLKLSVDEAVDFFSAQLKIHHALELMRAVGLGYLILGQPGPTLSGGEAQRGERGRGKGVGSGLARLLIRAGGTPARVTASHGPGIEPCSRSGNGPVDA